MSSALANMCRPGPSQQKALARVLVSKDIKYVSRSMASMAQGVASQPGYLKKNKGDEKYRARLPPTQELPEAQRATFANPNAHIAPKLPLLEPTILEGADAVGRATLLPAAQTDPLTVFGCPRKIQYEFKLLSKPASVVRDVTVATVNLLKGRQNKPSSETPLALVGPAGCGKSILLLQATEWAAQSGWVVIYIPQASSFVDSSTPYVYDIRTQTYLQPSASFDLLRRLLGANQATLSKIPLIQELVVEKRTFAAGTTLGTFLDAFVKDTVRHVPHAPFVLDVVMKSLDAQTGHPVLFAVDGVQALYHKSRYRDPHFQSIASYHLSIPRLILEYANGHRSFKNGTFLSALSRSDHAFPVPIELQDSLAIGYDKPTSPLDARSKSLLHYAAKLQPHAVPTKLTLQEASTIFEVWRDENLLSGKTYDEIFLSKYTESGGNARDFVWKGLLSSLAS